MKNMAQGSRPEIDIVAGGQQPPGPQSYVEDDESTLLCLSTSKLPEDVSTYFNNY